MSDPILLPLLWAGVIAFAVAMYVILDGFDLGIGILFPLAPRGNHRETMMNTVAPVWDGNETWLVLGGVGLFAAFPAAYSLLLPAVYLPIILMLIALILRGVAFEFRPRAQRSEWVWSLAFAGDSCLATFAQGMVLGTFVQGFAMHDGIIAAGPFVWLTPFSVMTGLGLVCGYALLGAGWIIQKTEGHLQQWAYAMARLALPPVVAFLALVSLWTPFAEPEIAQRWFALPNLFYLAPVPLLTGIAVLIVWVGVQRQRERWPFLGAIAIFMLSFFGLAISLWPYAVPRVVTIWDAAAQRETQLFMLVGVVVLIPVILLYTGYSYWVFRGKVRDEGYH